MQKMWAIAAITLVGFMMIISSIPQDAFAGKNTVTLKITITDNGNDLTGETCTVSARDGVYDFNEGEVTGGGNQIGTEVRGDVVIKGKTSKISFEFEDPDKLIKGYEFSCDGIENVLKVNAAKKNTRATYDYSV